MLLKFYLLAKVYELFDMPMCHNKNTKTDRSERIGYASNRSMINLNYTFSGQSSRILSPLFRPSGAKLLNELTIAASLIPNSKFHNNYVERWELR